MNTEVNNSVETLKLKVDHLKNVIYEQGVFIQYQRDTIFDLKKIIDILFKGIENFIVDGNIDIDKLRKEVFQCVEEEDVHFVDFADVDTKGGKNA